MDKDLARDAVLQTFNMADDADELVRPGQRRQRVDGLVQRFGVQRAETFVHKQRIYLHAARLLLDRIADAQRQAQRGQKALPARKAAHRAGLAGVGVEHIELQRRFGGDGGVLPPQQAVLPAGHAGKAQVGGGHHAVKVERLHILLKRQLGAAGQVAVDRAAQVVHDCAVRAGLFGLLQRGGQRGGGRAVGGQRVLRGGQPGAGLLLCGLGFVQGGLGGGRVGRFGRGGGLLAKGFGFAKGFVQRGVEPAARGGGRGQLLVQLLLGGGRPAARGGQRRGVGIGQAARQLGAAGLGGGAGGFGFAQGGLGGFARGVQRRFAGGLGGLLGFQPGAAGGAGAGFGQRGAHPGQAAVQRGRLGRKRRGQLFRRQGGGLGAVVCFFAFGKERGRAAVQRFAQRFFARGGLPGGRAGGGGGGLGGVQRAVGGFAVGLGDMAGGQPGRGRVVGRAADRAGRAFGQFGGQQPGARGVQAALCVVGGGRGFVLRGLFGAVGLLAGGQRARGLGQLARVGQQAVAFLLLGQRGLFVALVAGNVRPGLAAGGQRRGQFGAPPLPRSERLGGGFAVLSGFGGAGFGVRAFFFGFGQLGVARGQRVELRKLGGDFLQLGAAGLGFVPGGAAGGGFCLQAGGLGLGGAAALQQLRAGAGGFGRGGGLLDGGVQRLQLRGQRRGLRFALFEQLRGQRGRGGRPVGVLRGLQGAQRGGGVRFALLRAGRGQLQPPQFQQHAGVGVLGGAGGRGGALARGVAQAAVRPGVKHLPQDGRAVGAGGVEQAGKVVLRDQRDLRELFGVDAQQRRDGGGHGLRAADRLLRFAHKRRAGRGQRGGVGLFAAAARAQLLRRALDRIHAPAVGKGQRNKGLVAHVGKVAAQHGGQAVGAGRLAVQRKGDRVKQRGLARAGVAADQKQPAFAKGGQVQFGARGIGAERAQRQVQRFHSPTSFCSACSAVCSSAVIARPCICSKKPPNSSAKLFWRSASAVGAPGPPAPARGA